MHFVYIIYSQTIDNFYVGSSKDPIKRVKYHNLGLSGTKSSFTKRANDWIIRYLKAFNTKQEALKYEKRIKEQKSRKYIIYLIDGSE